MLPVNSKFTNLFFSQLIRTHELSRLAALVFWGKLNYSTRNCANMDPQLAGPVLESAKQGWRWKQMGTEEKTTAVKEEIKRMHRLPPNSSYASHRLRVLNKILQLLSIQVGLVTCKINYGYVLFCNYMIFIFHIRCKCLLELQN